MAYQNPNRLPLTSSCQRATHPGDLQRTTFYREELVKHWSCLEQQREYYSEKAITDVKMALSHLHAEMDELCQRENGDRLVSRLLEQIDGITRLSAWSDPKKHH